MSRLNVLSLLTLLCATPLAAQDKEKLCSDVLRRPLQVGQWASYNANDGSNRGSMRMAVVGTEKVAGSSYYWFEVAYNDPSKNDKGKTIVQLLVPGLDYQPGSVRGMIVKSGSEPAMRMSDAMLRMTAGQLDENFATEFARRCKAMDVVGWEQVTVPAGSFRALHIRDTADHTDAWFMPDLFFGLVRAKEKDGSTMELTGRGTDARSSITETPVTMPGLPR